MAIAERMKELLEKYVQHLEKEKTHFKYELEADNPGITEAIEKSKNFEIYCLKISFLENSEEHYFCNGKNSME